MTATRRLPSIVPPLLVALIGVLPVHASELDAIAISTNIRQFHMPYGTLLDPVFASSDPESPEYSDIVGYTRAGDSAIWTGHYLAAEAFRFRVTQSPDALSAVWQALLGIGTLLDVTGTDVLARCLVPADSPFAAGIQEEEGGHGIYYNTLGDQTYGPLLRLTGVGSEERRRRADSLESGFGGSDAIVDDASRGVVVASAGGSIRPGR